MNVISRVKGNLVALITVIIIVIGFFYIAYGLTDVVTTGKTIEEIILMGGLATLVGWIISILYSEMAITRSLNSELFINTEHEKGKIIQKITPNIGKVHVFCRIKNDMLYHGRVESLLRKAGLTLEQYHKKEYNPKNKTIKKTIKKINRSYYEFYTYDGLVNGTETDNSKKPKRKTLNGYRTKTYSKKILMSSLMGIMFGYFGLTFTKDPNWGTVIWLALQFASFNANGFIQYLFSQSFVEREFRGQLIKDINDLYDFDNSLRENPEWYIEESKPKIIEKVGELDEQLL